MENELVTLKEGTQLPKGLVDVTMSSLQLLMRKPTAFLEMIELARDPNYQISDNIRAVLDDGAFLDSSGNVERTITEVLLSTIEGEGRDLTLVSPIAE